jgi:hypothetical protein
MVTHIPHMQHFGELQFGNSKLDVGKERNPTRMYNSFCVVLFLQQLDCSSSPSCWSCLWSTVHITLKTMVPLRNKSVLRIWLTGTIAGTGTLKKRFLWRIQTVASFLKWLGKKCEKQKRHHWHIRSYNVLHFVSATSTAWAYQLAALSKGWSGRSMVPTLLTPYLQRAWHLYLGCPGWSRMCIGTQHFSVPIYTKLIWVLPINRSIVFFWIASCKTKT